MKKYCEKCIYHSLQGINKEFKRDEFIFLDGDKLDYVYLILSGFVKVSKTTQNGDERIFDIMGKNDFIAPSDSEIPTYQSPKDQIKLRCSII